MICKESVLSADSSAGRYARSPFQGPRTRVMAVICKRARVLVPTYGAKGVTCRWKENVGENMAGISKLRGDNPNLLFRISLSGTDSTRSKSRYLHRVCIALFATSFHPIFFTAVLIETAYTHRGFVTSQRIWFLTRELMVHTSFWRRDNRAHTILGSHDIGCHDHISIYVRDLQFMAQAMNRE